MSDQFDMAQDFDEQMRSSALAAQQKKSAAAVSATPTGECQNPKCGEPVDHPKLFCDGNCAKQYSMFKK